MASANVVNTLIVPAASKVAPYYDDFDESKNFHKIMFRPGYAVQARELTQIQTILQNQIERFGRHIFVNGSSVIGGKLDISDIVTLNVESQYQNSDITISEFKNKTIIFGSGNTSVQARVIETSEKTTTEPACLHVRYLTGQEFSNGDTILTTTGNLYANINATAVNATSNNAYKANGSLGFIYDSIYFMQGYFVKVPKQTVVVSKFHRQANVKVGLEYQDDIITEYNDASLLEPAQGTSNYQAPGAARYKVDLILSTRPLDSTDDEKYINVADLENGIIKRRYSSPTYSEIEEVLARRTYDESGNYIVKPFKIKVEDPPDPANNVNVFSLSISAGKAYVYGFEAENQATTNILIPRARDTKSRKNYNIPVNYGNYLIVENVRGTFDTNRQGLTDLHCVMWDQINTTNTATYNATKVGTARVKDISYYGAADAANTISRQYELFLYDTKFSSITGNASALNANTSQITLDTANAAAVANAYVGAYIKVIAGNAAGDLRYITGYNGTTKTANVSIPFSITTNSSTQYEIRPDITDVDSVYQSSVYTGGATTNAAATISLSNKDDGTYNGNTFISEPSFSDSFYPYPATYIAPGIANVSYVYRRVYNSVTFSAGLATITSAVNEQFDGVTSTSNTSSAVMDNFLVVVTNSVGSSRSVGDQVKVKITRTTTTPETCLLDTSDTSESFTATVYSRMQITDPSPRVKTLVKANTSHFSNASPSATFVNPSNSITRVYLSAGQVVIQNPSSSNSESLYISDVISVPKIYYTASNPTAYANLKSFADVTDDYTIQTGQKNEYYNHAKIKPKGGTVTKPGYLIVCCRYYSHTNDTGFFSVDSYPSLNTMVVEECNNLATGYALVPTINGIRLTDQVDFRPARPNASNTESWTFNTARIPIAVTDFTSDFSYYLERRDIVVMTVNDELKLITGNINNRQNYPDTPARSLLLHRIRVLPYTVTKNDIIVDTLDHRRYTMADIGRIDKRVKQLEYTTTLNALEKSASDIVITDVNGLDRTKYGILAEDFTSHLLGDTNNPDYSCAVDVTGTFSPTGGILMPRTVTNYIKLQANTSSATNLSVFEDKAMLAFTTTPAISQPFATKSTSLSDYLFADFRGQIITTPESDQWKDVTTRPPEVVSLPEPKIVFDITATDTTYNITNNTTNISNTFVTPVNIETVDVERLLIVSNPAANGVSSSACYLGLLQPLKWNPSGGVSAINGAPFPDGFYLGNLLNPFEIWFGPELDASGNIETVGMKKVQFWHLMDKMIKGTGYNSPGQLSALSWETYDMVYGFYDVILNRPPDPAGCVFWCMEYVIHKWGYQQLREIMTIAAIQNGELSQHGQTWQSNINLTPKYLIGADLTASLAGDKKVDISQAGIYNTTTTPDGRIQALAPSDGAAIEEMYQTFLGRNAEPEGKAYWIQTFTEWDAKYGREKAVTMLHDEFRYTARPLERKGLDEKYGGQWVSSYYFDT